MLHHHTVSSPYDSGVSNNEYRFSSLLTEGFIIRPAENTPYSTPGYNFLTLTETSLVTEVRVSIGVTNNPIDLLYSVVIPLTRNASVLWDHGHFHPLQSYISVEHNSDSTLGDISFNFRPLPYRDLIDLTSTGTFTNDSIVVMIELNGTSTIVSNPYIELEHHN